MGSGDFYEKAALRNNEAFNFSQEGDKGKFNRT
jgi:hypothetical protein